MTAMPQGNSSDAYVTPGVQNSWSAVAPDSGSRSSNRLLAVTTIEPADTVRDELRLGPGDRVVVRDRLIMLEDRPAELASSYYPAVIAAGTPLADAKKIRGGAVTALSDLGFATADVTEQVTARLPTAEEAALLDISSDEPLIALSRTSRDAAGRPIEYAVNRMVARLTGPVVYRMGTPR